MREGDRPLGSVSGTQLSFGLDLRAFPDLPTNARGQELLKLIRRKERLLSPAWLTHVGHPKDSSSTRPQTPAGLPLDQARRMTDPLEEQIRRLSQPVILAMRLVPVA